MSKYGSDKPDTRFGLEIQHVTDITGDNIVEGIVLKGDMKLSGSELKKLAQLDNKVKPHLSHVFFSTSFVSVLLGQYINTMFFCGIMYNRCYRW